MKGIGGERKSEREVEGREKGEGRKGMKGEVFPEKELAKVVFRDETSACQISQFTLESESNVANILFLTRLLL